MIKGITFFRSYHEALKELPDDQLVKIYRAMMDFVFEGTEPELSGVEKAVFALIRPSLEKSITKSNARNTDPSNEEQGLNQNHAEIKTESNQDQTGIEPESNRNQNSKMTSEDKDKDKDKDKGVIESTSPAREDAGRIPAKEPRNKYGKYGWVRLTVDEHKRLLDDLGAGELQRCIDYVDESAQGNGNKNRWKDWNLVIRKCSREGWGMRGVRAAPISTPSYDLAAFEKAIYSSPPPGV